MITASPLNSLQKAPASPPQSHEYILSPQFKISSEPTTRKYSLTVTESTAALDGFLRPALAINGQIPGPLIEANEGDRLEITVTNQMDIALTIHWHGLYQNGTNWEDGVTGVTQCPIPPNGGSYTYIFDLDGQFGTFWYHSHHQNLMADGIYGPLIIHSPRDPLKRSIDFDQEVVLILADWYHNTSTEINSHMLSEAGYFGTPAAPAPNSALINGVGEWNCSFATQSQRCLQINSPPVFTFKAGEKIRFRLVNAGVHAMFFYSVDEHKLNLTEADATGIHGPSDLHRVWLHNGQRYSVVIKTKEEDAGRNFYMRAIMDPDCWAWVPDDVQLTGFGIIQLIDSESLAETNSISRPTTLDWPDDTFGDCLDLDVNSMVPILNRSVPSSVMGSGAFEAGFGYQFINNTSEFITRAEAAVLALQANSSSVNSTSNSTVSNTQNTTTDGSSIRKQKKTPLQYKYLNKRQVAVGQQDLPFGNRTSPPGFNRTAGPPPTPQGTIGKFFVNNISWATYPYQPVLHDLTPGGVGAINNSRVANVIFPTADWYDLYLVNIDPGLSHPWHLHALDMYIVASGTGLPTTENLANLTYNTENPLRRDTIVVPPAAFIVVRVIADIPGAWLVHCHIGWHLAGGFAGVVTVQPEAIKQFQIPQKNLDLCKARVGPLDTIEPGL